MKFDMGAQTLSILTKQTGNSHEDLGTLVRQLVDSVVPLEDKFHGQARVRFDQFKRRADGIAGELNGSLAAILGGQAGMDVAFQAGDQEGADNASTAEGGANFDGARFGASRA